MASAAQLLTKLIDLLDLLEVTLVAFGSMGHFAILALLDMQTRWDTIALDSVVNR